MILRLTNGYVCPTNDESSGYFMPLFNQHNKGPTYNASSIELMNIS